MEMTEFATVDTIKVALVPHNMAHCTRFPKARQWLQFVVQLMCCFSSTDLVLFFSNAYKKRGRLNRTSLHFKFIYAIIAIIHYNLVSVHTVSINYICPYPRQGLHHDLNIEIG